MDSGGRRSNVSLNLSRVGAHHEEAKVRNARVDEQITEGVRWLRDKQARGCTLTPSETEFLEKFGAEVPQQ